MPKPPAPVGMRPLPLNVPPRSVQEAFASILRHFPAHEVHEIEACDIVSKAVTGMPSQPTPTTLHIRVDEFGQEYDERSGRLLHEITSGRTGMDRTRCRSVLQSAAEAGVMGPGSLGDCTYRPKTDAEIAADIAETQRLAESRRQLQRDHEVIEITGPNGERIVTSRREAEALRARSSERNVRSWPRC